MIINWPIQTLGSWFIKKWLIGSTMILLSVILIIKDLDQ